jgi:hypothetical protein
MSVRSTLPLAHPDNRLPGEPEAKAEAAGVEGGRREARSFEVSDRDPM